MHECEFVLLETDVSQQLLIFLNHCQLLGHHFMEIYFNVCDFLSQCFRQSPIRNAVLNPEVVGIVASTQTQNVHSVVVLVGSQELKDKTAVSKDTRPCASVNDWEHFLLLLLEKHTVVILEITKSRCIAIYKRIIEKGLGLHLSDKGVV